VAAPVAKLKPHGSASDRLPLTNVLILSLVFPPDSVSTAEIMGDLAQDLSRYGHRVTVLTTVPHYNPDAAAEQSQPLQSFWGRLLRSSDYHGIRVYHAAIPAKTPSVVRRVLGWVGFHAISTMAALVTVPRPDIILAPSPPLSIGLSAWIIGVLRGSRFIYNVQEIYPDIAVSLGALKNPTLIGFLSAVERFVYRGSAFVTVIAPRMHQRLVAKGVPAAKVRVIPNFVDLERLTPAPRDNEFSRRFDLRQAFAVTYAGNMGPAQGLETVIEAARLLREEDGPVRFLLLGEGILRGRLELAASALPRQNVSVLPYQPGAMMPQIYAASDVCLVPQAASTGCDAVPSKVYRIMASGRPLIAITERDSDLATLVRDAQCGAIVAPGDAKELARLIVEAARQPEEWRDMGLRGRAHVTAYYSRRIVTAEYDALIRTVAGEIVVRS
jgi:colanic acid biosynthesis glycosyl transferase WcaI